MRVGHGTVRGALVSRWKRRRRRCAMANGGAGRLVCVYDVARQTRTEHALVQAGEMPARAIHIENGGSVEALLRGVINGSATGNQKVRP